MIASLPPLIGSTWALRPHPDRAAAGGVGVADPVEAHDGAAAGEVRALDVLHQTLQVDLRVLDEGVDGAGHLAQVVGRDVRRHPDSDAGGPLTSRLGKRDGRSSGSCVRSS